MKEKIYTNNPLVSIIVITYNSSKFVLETLDSIYNQTYQNIELIISDDASGDDTVKICSNWLVSNKKRFVRIKTITIKTNSGIPANCNRGVKVAQGDWVKLIAADDTLMNNCITDNIYHIQNNPNVNVLLSSTAKYNEEFKKECFIKNIPVTIPIDFFGENISANHQYNLLLKSDRIMTTPTNFIKKSAILGVGFYDERFKLIEDYPMWLKLTKANYKLDFMDKITVKHRVHKNSTNNIKNEFILKPTYFRNEKLRKELVYPNIDRIDVLRQKTIFYYAVIFRRLGLNSRTKTNKNIFNFFTRYLNPFAIVLHLKKKANKLI